MLLLSKVRFWDIFSEICEAVRGRERPWEAVRGREALIGSDRSGTLWHRSLSQWEEHGLSWPLTFGLSRPLIASASQNLSCDLSEPIREHGLSQIWESDWPLTHTGRCNAFSREISQTAPRMTASPGVRERPIGLSNLWGRVRERPWESDWTLPAEAMRLAVKSVRRARGWQHCPVCVRGRSDSQICEAVCVRGRTHHKVMWSVWESEASHGLTDRPHRSVWESEVRGRVGGRSASHAHRASRTSTGQGSTILGLAWLISRLNALLRPVEVRLARCAWEADRPPTRPLTSDSHGLTDRTPWQIWLSDRSDRLDWS